jgi:hypothetical protein
MIKKLFILFVILSSCSKQNIDNTITEGSHNKYKTIFIKKSENKPELKHSIEYYKDSIIKYREMFDDRQKISTIIEVKDIIPDYLCFLVCWDDNLKGYIYELYPFDHNQNIVQKYLVGYGPKFNYYSNVLMDKLPGNKIAHEQISYGDFNGDGICEILSFSLYTQIGYVFTIFGYNAIENDFIHTCLVPVYINFENPFSPVEYNINGFRILEVIEIEGQYEYFELAWNDYSWDINVQQYLRK